MRLSLRRAVAALTLTALGIVALPGHAHAYDVARVKSAIRRAWGGNDRRAIRVARCESGLNPRAISESGRYRGLWQFSRATWNDYDGPGDDPIDVGAFKQTQVAYRLFLDRGWQPWPTCGASRARAADEPRAGPQWTDARRHS